MQNSLVEILPFDLLLSQETVDTYLTNFALLRSDIRVRVQIMSNPMQYGMVMISKLPYRTTAPETTYSSLQQLSQANPQFIDIAGENQVEMILPYTRPELYRLVLDSGKDWKVYLRLISLDTATTEAPTSLQYQVYASFVNPQAAMYRVPSAQLQAFQPGAADGVMANRMNTLFNAAMATGTAASVGLPMLLKGAQEALKLTKTAEEGVQTAGEVYEKFRSMTGLKQTTYEGQEEEAAPPPKPSKNVKMDLLGDLSTPEASGIRNTSCRLGDGMFMPRRNLPTENNIYGIAEMCAIPTYFSTDRLTSMSDSIVYPGNPFQPYTYAKHFARIFKYWRGNVKYHLHFLIPSLAHARVKIALSPTGEEPFGYSDVPTWFVDVNANKDVEIEIPYLQINPWQIVQENLMFVPKLTVQLVAPIPQTFDKPISVTVVSFISATEMAFSGLESFVPEIQITEEASLQSFNQTSRFGYQGGISSVAQILGRFSSRAPDPDLYVPSPIMIKPNLADQYDNFDYISSLYCFYTGGCHVKMVFNNTATNGTIACEISNSKQSYTGKALLAGNSVAVSHQSIWPVVEFYYPYMREYEFDTVADSTPQFPPRYTDGAQVTQFFIAAGEDFMLAYLMPVYVDNIVILQSFSERSPLKRSRVFHKSTVTSPKITTDIITYLPSQPSVSYFVETNGVDSYFYNYFTLGQLQKGSRWEFFMDGNLEPSVAGPSVWCITLYLSDIAPATLPMNSWGLNIDSSYLAPSVTGGTTIAVASKMITTTTGPKEFSFGGSAEIPFDTFTYLLIVVTMAVPPLDTQLAKVHATFRIGPEVTSPVSVVGTPSPTYPVWTSAYRPE